MLNCEIDPAALVTSVCFGDLQVKIMGPESAPVAESLNKLAEMFRQQGKYDNALQLMEQALRIQGNVTGEDHPDTIKLHNNIGLVMQTMGRLDEAERYFEHAVSAYEKVSSLLRFFNCKLDCLLLFAYAPPYAIHAIPTWTTCHLVFT